MDIGQLIKEHAPALLERLKTSAGFGGEEAEGFLGGLMSQITSMLGSGTLDVGDLLGSDGLQSLRSKINVSELAGQAKVDAAKAQQGLDQIGGPLVDTLRDAVDDPSDLLKMIGGGDDESGGTLGNVGKLAGGFFKK